MEKAIFISRIENLAHLAPEHSRLYYGNEFCEHLVPSPADLTRVLEVAGERGLDFTLVTPFVTNRGIEALKPLVEEVGKRALGAEIVVNDWGMLKVLGESFGRTGGIVLGRLLTKQKRGPRILNIRDRVPARMIEHFRMPNVDVPVLSDFLLERGIDRVELDNPLQGIQRSEPRLAASLYYPFVYVTTTRYCLTATCEGGRKNLRSITPCGRECGKYAFTLSHRHMPVKLLLRGNTQFFRNDALPENLEELKIDRLVYEPEIPM